MSTHANIDKTASALSGALVLVGLMLGLHVHPYWYALAAFMAGNLMQAPVTGFCPLVSTLERFGDLWSALKRRLAIHRGNAATRLRRPSIHAHSSPELR